MGSKGQLSNVPLREVLLETLITQGGSIKFIKVPSHVNVMGNNEADRVVDQVKLSHPPCLVLQTLAPQDRSHDIPPPSNEGGECPARISNQFPQHCSIQCQNPPTGKSTAIL